MSLTSIGGVHWLLLVLVDLEVKWEKVGAVSVMVLAVRDGFNGQLKSLRAIILSRWIVGWLFTHARDPYLSSLAETW